MNLFERRKPEEPRPIPTSKRLMVMVMKRMRRRTMDMENLGILVE